MGDGKENGRKDEITPKNIRARGRPEVDEENAETQGRFPLDATRRYIGPVRRRSLTAIHPAVYAPCLRCGPAELHRHKTCVVDGPGICSRQRYARLASQQFVIYNEEEDYSSITVQVQESHEAPTKPRPEKCHPQSPEDTQNRDGQVWDTPMTPTPPEATPHKVLGKPETCQATSVSMNETNSWPLYTPKCLPSTSKKSRVSRQITCNPDLHFFLMFRVSLELSLGF